MAMSINTNLTSLGTLRNLNSTLGRLNITQEKLSSGLRINKAKDDAAGLAIAELFRTEVLQQSQEVENLQSGVSAIHTAEGALSTQSEGIGRLRELAIQASNGILNDDQRSAINAEAQQIIEQIDQTGSNTTFNDLNLLDGSTGTIELGTEAGSQININESTAESLGINGIDLSTAGGAAAAIETLDTAAQDVTENRANLGAQENRLTYAIAEREIEGENAAAAESRIRDLDIARAAIDQMRDEVMTQSGIAALAQGNIVPQMAAQLLGG